MPGFGGPTGVGSVGGLGSTVYSYGNSELRGGITKLSPKQGVVVQNEGGGWSHNVLHPDARHPRRLGQRLHRTAPAQAIGVLSTLQLAPLPASNGVGDLAKELAYLRSHSPFSGLELVPGHGQPSKATCWARSSAPERSGVELGEQARRGRAGA